MVTASKEGGASLNILSGLVAGNFSAYWLGLTIMGLMTGAYFLYEMALSSTMIGGATAAARNVISGNALNGVRLAAGADNTTIEQNYIGTTADGESALGNTEQGIFVEGTSATNITGTVIAANVVSANGVGSPHYTGIRLEDDNGTVVRGNLIGADAAGDAALGNGGHGVRLLGSTNDTIGGTSAADRNIISGNAIDGLYVDPGSTGNTIEGNYVGTNATGTAALANGRDGIEINGSANNTIGGTAAGEANTIAYNGFDGVAVTGTSATGNAIRGNSIYGNGKLGIDLGGSGAPVANDSLGHVGPNDFQNFPLLTSVTSDGTTTTFAGTLNASASTTYTIDFYANPASDPTKFGQGQTYIGSTAVTTDGSGAASIAAAFNYNGTLAANGGQQPSFSATATDPAANTSEFGPDYPTPAIAVTIGAPATATEGITVQLTSTVTDANGGASLSYNWSATTPSGSTLGLGAAANQPSLQLDPIDTGVYTIALTVTDSQGAAGQATTTLDVTATAPVVIVQSQPATPSASPGPAPVTAVTGVPIALLGTLVAPSADSLRSFTWSVTKDGAAFALPAGTATNQLDFAFTPTVAGDYTITLMATDANGGTTSALANVLVTSATPVAEIVGAPGISPEGMPLALSNQITAANFTGTLSYAWSVTKDGQPYKPGAATNQATFDFTPNDEGSYQVGLSVSNGTATGIAPPVTIDVTEAPYTATITGASGQTPTTNVTAGTAIHLVGAAGTSGTLDSQTTTYAWSVTDNGLPYTLPGGTLTDASTFGFTPTAAGEYLLTLTATDTGATVNGAHPTATALAAFNVGAPAISVSLAASGSLTEGGAVTVAATATPTGTYSYVWTVTDESDPVAVTDTSGQGTPSFNFTPPTPGSYQVSVTLSDGQASVTTSTIVRAANEPPTAPVITVTNGTATLGANPSVLEGTALALSAASTDLGGANDQLSYSWTVAGPNGFSLSSNGAAFNFTPIESGAYTVTAAATDLSGATTTSQDTITVTHVTPQPTIQVRPDTGLNGSGQLFVDLTATVPDPGSDDPFSYAWTVTDPSGNTWPSNSNAAVTNVSTNGLPDFSFTDTSSGTYTVSLTVTDDDGGNATASTPILTVGANSTLTLTAPPAGATQVLAIALGAGATIDASGLPTPVVEAALGGHDSLVGGSGSSVLQGDSGFNTLLGGSGANTLYGSAGDMLFGDSVPAEPAPPF
ncbi:MAG TPA: right-handed parallel beta-helix repeat-containing protein, partial [Pirellulales bacterium]|nr:right-handed parallel beta-helix repeat-containing protein [Pirellulales bacterium]